MRPGASGTALKQDNRQGEGELPDLMVRYQRGDVTAAEELIRRLSPSILRYLVPSRLQKSDLEDLFQECWMRIHRSRHTYRAPEPVLPWIFAIARHTRLDGYRSRRRRESREILVANLPETSARFQRSPEPEQDEFYRLLNDLPESQRDVLLMLKVSGMSLEEVARATSSTVGAIKQKAHRAYERLRLKLRPAKDCQ